MPPKPQRFRSKIVLGGKTATGFEVPAEVVEKLGAGKRPPVSVTINGHTYRSTVAVFGGKFFLPLNAQNRAAAGVAAGDSVTVAVALDSAPRVVDVPPDFKQALARDAVAQTHFEKLSYSHKREYVEAIVEAKRPETRARRIAKAVEILRRAGN